MASSKPKPKPDFAAFNPRNNSSLRLAIGLVRRLAGDLRRSPWADGYCAALLGPSGTGKTMLARCLLAELKTNAWRVCGAVPARVHAGQLEHFEAVWCDWRGFSDQLKRGEWGAVDGLLEPRLLVLDDVGADYDPHSIAAGKLDYILRQRAGRWTLLTSNLLLADISEQLDRRVASWLARDDNKFVEIEAEDYALIQ